LLLARMLTRPANVLVLDEPTNDLDLETLELLEEQLLEWPGTLLLVSHDRRFLDNVVTSTIAYEGEGWWREYVGGYHDWLRQRGSQVHGFTGSPVQRFTGAEVQGSQVQGSQVQGSQVQAPEVPGSQVLDVAPAAVKRKLSYKEQRELEALPASIAALEEEQRALEARTAGPEFYKEGADAIRAALERSEAVGMELHIAYERWLELEAIAMTRASG
jgi:ATP-binding cassette subfamily F protein uup